MKTFEDQQFELLQKRYSGRSYDTTRDVSREQLQRLKEAAQLAPSTYNEQPWRYIICQKKEHPEGYQKILDSLAPANQSWAKNAPVLMVSICSELFKRNNQPNILAHHDTGAASISMALEAASLGLMMHQMGGFDASKIISSFELPPGYTPCAAIAVGYQNKEEGFLPKQRNPLDQHMFMGKWQH